MNAVRKHSDVEFICDILQVVEKGQSYPKQSLTMKLGVSDYREIATKVSQAITRLRNKYGKVFKAKGDNLVHLTDEQNATDNYDTRRINRIAKNRQVKLTCVDRNNLSNSGKVAFDANVMLTSIQENLSNEGASQVIQGKVASGSATLTIGQTLELFK
jgi:hypothetical protein